MTRQSVGWIQEYAREALRDDIVSGESSLPVVRTPLTQGDWQDRFSVFASPQNSDSTAASSSFKGMASSALTNFFLSAAGDSRRAE